MIGQIQTLGFFNQDSTTVLANLLMLRQAALTSKTCLCAEGKALAKTAPWLSTLPPASAF